MDSYFNTKKWLAESKQPKPKPNNLVDILLYNHNLQVERNYKKA